MSRKPRPGGRVQISGRQYDVLEPPVPRNGYFTLRVRHADGTELIAEAPAGQGGKGPWKISAPAMKPRVEAEDFASDITSKNFS